MRLTRYTMIRGVSSILIATLIISGIPWALWLGHGSYLDWRAQDTKNQIVAVVQKSPEKGILKTTYLADLLELSYDQPTNLFHFNSHEAEKKLLISPLIKRAKIKKIPPGTIYIEYLARKPIAFLGDYTNTAMDEDGILFPFKPFFTPKKLPEITLGTSHIETEETMSWGKTFQTEQTHLALKLLKLINQEIGNEGFKVSRIDLSHALSSSYGQKEILITLESHFISKEHGSQLPQPKLLYLRLNVDDYAQSLGNFNELQKYLKANSKKLPLMVDLRVPHYAYIKGE